MPRSLSTELGVSPEHRQEYSHKRKMFYHYAEKEGGGENVSKRMRKQEREYGIARLDLPTPHPILHARGLSGAFLIHAK